MLNQEQSETQDLRYETYPTVRIWSDMLTSGFSVQHMRCLVEKHIEALLNHKDSTTPEFVAAIRHSKQFLSTLNQQ